jgi:hypothetical protein|tara:strand:- start:633 stop:755 length:123 start_codon:yes stop_codon:yes gene_type:complete
MKNMIIIIGIVMILTTGCTKDFDLNPTSTIVRAMFKGNSK